MRQIILDTETTGLDPREGHRIIEIGCVEMVNRRVTKNNYHVYINPERQIDAEAIEVHGITNESLIDKPFFADIADAFCEFVEGAELIIHNAPFDIGFINHELGLLNKPAITELCTVYDTLEVARKKHPGQRNSLDALCKRYGIDNSHRELHGALLDSEILADVYLMMTGGQTSLLLDEHSNDDDSGEDEMARQQRARSKKRPALRVIRCSGEELELHRERLAAIDKGSDGACLWLKEPH